MMGKNIKYISIILLLLLCEIFAYVEEKQLYQALWVNLFKVLSLVTFGMWYFQAEKTRFKLIQKLFLGSNLLAIIITLFYFFLPLQEGLYLIYCLNIVVFFIWIYVFRLMGARIIYKKSDDFFKKLIPVFFVFPVAYYFLTLYPILTIFIAILKLIFTITLSYACLIAIFLPINSEKKLWITLGIILFIFISLLYSNYLFIENKVWSYVISRIVITISKIMMVYGMIDFNKGIEMELTEEE